MANAAIGYDQRDAVQQAVGPSLPATCPFHSERDRLRYDDVTARRITANYGQFTCLRCNKMFKTEYHLDKHFDNRHNETSTGEGGADLCLADFCDILQCRPVTERDAITYPLARQLQANDAQCLDGGGAGQRAAVCELAMNACFPPERDDGGVTRSIHGTCCSFVPTHIPCL